MRGAATVADVDLARQREVVDAFLAASRRGDFNALVAVLDPDVVPRADLPAGASKEVRGARAVAEQALAYSWRARFSQAALVNGSVGIVVAPQGRLFAVMGFKITRRNIVEIHVLADPARELRVFLRAGGLMWGGLSLMREASQPDFEPEEVELVSHVSRSLAEALRRTLLQSPTPRLQAQDDTPAVIVISSDDRVVSITQTAETLLDELADAGTPDPERLPTAIRAVPLRARYPLGAKRSASASVRTPGGRWLTLRAATLDQGQRVAVVIERTRPDEAAALILAAYGLSAREREIAQCVRRGLSSEDVSEALGISVWTVQDHFKSIFDKTGLSSRKELAARLYFASSA